MHYIILDLEWNSAYCPWQKGFLNEIIEFGAVKLDENLKEVSRFQCFVRSKLTKRLRARVKGLTNITNDQMRSGISIEKAIRDYTQWAGKDTVTLTWSNTDIYVLVENLKTLMGKETIPFLYGYVDIQKYVQNRLGVTGNQIDLGTAAEMLNVNFEEFAAHRALGDSLCTAEILRRTWDSERGLKGYVTDATKEEYYKRLFFKPYIISDINNPAIDKEQLRCRCPDCDDFMGRKTKWKYKNRYFIADFECKKCGKQLLGRLRFKKTYDGVVISRSIIPPKPPKAEEEATTENTNEANQTN